jgi:hypothetical protein
LVGLIIPAFTAAAAVSQEGFASQYKMAAHQAIARNMLPVFSLASLTNLT